MTLSAPVAIDAFSGAGGVSLGLEWAGFRVRGAFDFAPSATETYRNNLGPHIICEASENLSGHDLLRLAGVELGECELLAGGPPCQGFSVQRIGVDTDSRNELIGDFLRHVRAIQPRSFLLENVPALAGRRGASFLRAFESGARELGYATEHRVLDAADFGVPQHRRRLMVVGIRGNQPFEWPASTHDAESWVTVREAIGALPDPRIYPASRRLPNHDPDNISELNRERIAYVPEGGGRADIPFDLQLQCHRVSVDVAGHRGVYGRLWWDKPAGTITTKCNSFTRGRFAHPVQDRNITMREAARLQGFPDDFVFAGGRVDVAHQIGNAVPPPLAMAIGAAIAKQIAG